MLATVLRHGLVRRGLEAKLRECDMRARRTVAALRLARERRGIETTDEDRALDARLVEESRMRLRREALSARKRA